MATTSSRKPAARVQSFRLTEQSILKAAEHLEEYAHILAGRHAFKVTAYTRYKGEMLQPLIARLRQAATKKVSE